jgi:hypothetical protein
MIDQIHFLNNLKNVIAQLIMTMGFLNQSRNSIPCVNLPLLLWIDANTREDLAVLLI